MSFTQVSIQEGIMRQVNQYLEAQLSPLAITPEDVRSSMALAYLSGYANCCDVLTINDGSLTPQRLMRGLSDVFNELGVTLTRKESSTESNHEQT